MEHPDNRKQDIHKDNGVEEDRREMDMKGTDPVTISLEQLPIEILQEILHLLVAPYCSCTEWSQSHRRLSLRENPFAFSPQHRAILAPVSLVSKALNRVARPIIYETVYLSTALHLRVFASSLLGKAKGSSRVESQWVRRLVVDVERDYDDASQSQEVFAENLQSVFTMCSNIHTIKLYLWETSVISGAERAIRLSYHDVVSLWNALPNTLRNLSIPYPSFVPLMSPADFNQFVQNHKEISVVHYSHAIAFASEVYLDPFPHLTSLCTEFEGARPDLARSRSSLNTNTTWSSLKWLRVGYSYIDINAGFERIRYDSLVSLALGRFITFNSLRASVLFSSAPNLEELQFRIRVQFGVKVGWGSYNEVTGLFVKHQNLKYIEIFFGWWGREGARDEVEPAEKIVFCDDFRGLGSREDFPSLDAVDVYMETYDSTSRTVNEDFRKEIEVAVGTNINPSTRLRVLINRIGEDCNLSQVHYDY